MSPQLGALIGFVIGSIFGFLATLAWISLPEIKDWIKGLLRKN